MQQQLEQQQQQQLGSSSSSSSSSSNLAKPPQQQTAGEDGYTTVGKPGKPVRAAAEMDDEAITSDWDITDTEDETLAANEGRAPARKKMKKTTQAEKKTIQDKRGAKRSTQTGVLKGAAKK